MRDNTRFTDALTAFGLSLTDGQLVQLEQYYELLIEWNEVMNLTAITEYEEVLVKHFADSLSLYQFCPDIQKGRLLDLGTGAGFPGIPLKIAFPELEIVLLDSLNKRIGFLNTVIEKLGLTGITAIHARAEEAAGKAEYREQFDYCVSRAVARLSTLSEYALPYVKCGGYFIPYKSGEIKEETAEAKFAVNLLGGKIMKTEEFVLPNTDMKRSFIFIKKEKTTPKKYPRGQGKPSKQPLIQGEGK